MFRLSVFLLLLSIPWAASTCADSDTSWNNFCYSFHSNEVDFASAEIACTKLGGHLASIHDAFTDAVITDGALQNILSNQTDIWIGASNYYTLHAWSWTDGTQLDFKEWEIGEPNDDNQYACASLSKQTGYWKAQNCFNKNSFVCAVSDGDVKPPTTTTARTTTSTPMTTAKSTTMTSVLTSSASSTTSTVISSKSTPSTQYVTSTLSSTTTGTTSSANHFYNCSHGWIYFEPTQSCYSIRYSGQNSWERAKAMCVQQNAQLPSIHSYEELQFLHTFIEVSGRPMWTGLTSPDGGKTWSWTDGTPVDYLPWLNGPPNITAGQISVVIASNSNNFSIGGLLVGTGISGVPFCQKRIPFNPTPPPPAPFYNCSAGWVYFEPAHACYGGINGAQGETTWQGAENYCRDLGGHLPSIHNYEELSYVLEFALNWSGNLWIGLNNNGTNWVWSDGSPITYLPGLEDSTPQANYCGCVPYNNDPTIIKTLPCSSSTAFVCKKELY